MSKRKKSTTKKKITKRSKMSEKVGFRERNRIIEK